MRPSHGHNQEDGVQADEHRRPAPRAAEPARCSRHQRDARQARRDGDTFQRPQARRETERRDGVARQREQRAVWRVLVEPADELKGRIGRRVGRHVRIGVEAVERAEPGEVQIAEDVLRYERWAEEQDRMRAHDRRGDRAHRQAPGEQKHGQVARAHEQHERLEAAGADADIEALERSGQPVRPPAVAGRDVRGGFRGRSGGHENDAHGDSDQADQACQPRCSRAASRLRRRAEGSSGTARDPQAVCGGHGSDLAIVTSRRSASVPPTR